MLKFGPYTYSGSWARYRESEGLPDLCTSGIDHVFPDLSPNHRMEFRLYAQKPRTDAIQADLIFTRFTRFRANNQIELVLLGESVFLPKSLHREVLRELGLTWSDVPSKGVDDEDERTWIVWLRAVELDELPVAVEDVGLEIWDKDSAELVLRGSNGLTATVSVPFGDLSWE